MIENIRRNNYPEILALESKYNTKYDEEFKTHIVYSSAWISKEQFEEAAVSRAVGIYCTDDNNEKISGYAIYKIDKKHIRILKIEGDDAALYELVNRIEKVGKELCKSVISFTSDERRLDQHLRLSALGFMAKHVTKNVFDDNDGYYFELEISND